MPEALNELQRLSKEMHAKATVTIEDGFVRVSFKANGRRAEVVNDESRYTNYPASNADEIVAELLKRLGYAGARLQTNGEFIRLVRQRPAKLALLTALLAQIRDIRRDVFIAVEEIEPRLASPRSSLNPYFMQGSDE
jgi:hypothetical protein